MNVTLDHIEKITEHIQTFWLRPDGRFRYAAGQFTEIHLPHIQSDTRGNKRWFTLSSSPTEELLAITTTFANGQGSSFKHALRKLQPGDQLQLSAALGDFVLPKDSQLPIVFVAAGLGITPIRSITKWLLDSGERRDIHVIHAVRHQQSLAFQDLLQRCYGRRFTPIVSQPAPDWQGETGKLSVERLQQYITRADTLVYLAGPERLAKTFAEQLIARGLPRHQIITDYFPGYADI